jgi:hypothetical protein
MEIIVEFVGSKWMLFNCIIRGVLSSLACAIVVGNEKLTEYEKISRYEVSSVTCLQRETFASNK